MSDTPIPARQELTVIPADAPTERTLGFVIREYDGTEVFRVDEPGVRLTRESDLAPGVKVLVTTLFGVHEMVVKRDSYGVLSAEDAGTIADLVFAKDDRGCWSSRYAINKSTLKRVTKTSVTP